MACSCSPKAFYGISAGVCFAAFVAFLVPAVIDLKYGINHYYTETDLAEARERAYVFCNSTRCIPDCTQFNSQMEVFVQDSLDVFKYVCTKTCFDNNCSVICPDQCLDSWSTYDHIRDNTGENGQYRYNRGAGFMAAACICVFFAGVFFLFQDSARSIV